MCAWLQRELIRSKAGWCLGGFRWPGQGQHHRISSWPTLFLTNEAADKTKDIGSELSPAQVKITICCFLNCWAWPVQIGKSCKELSDFQMKRFQNCPISKGVRFSHHRNLWSCVFCMSSCVQHDQDQWLSWMLFRSCLSAADQKN